MFGADTKKKIADAVQHILRSTGDWELPIDEIQFSLHVDGRDAMSWADIRNNGAAGEPSLPPLRNSTSQRRN